MPRFFNPNIEHDMKITGDDAVHIAKSLRMKQGDLLVISDGACTDYSCEIASISSQEIVVEILNKSLCENEPKVMVTLFQCLTKGDKMDDIIKHSVELGVSNIVPVLSSRCISRPDVKQQNAKLQRWNKIAREAASQCGRGILPSVADCISINNCAKQLHQFDLSLFFYEQGGSSLINVVNNNVTSVAIIIGSEGGFAENEALLLEKSSAKTVTLGPRILRAETAPLAALSAVMLLTGNM